MLSPLPVWAKRTPLAPGELELAMAEVAGLAGAADSPLAASEYWPRLMARLDGAGEGAEQTALRSALGDLADLAGATTLSFGSWHGDWTAWNMASTRDGLLVWDWERFTAPAPVGYDALHCWLQAEVVGNGRDPARAAVTLPASRTGAARAVRRDRAASAADGPALPRRPVGPLPRGPAGTGGREARRSAPVAAARAHSGYHGTSQRRVAGPRAARAGLPQRPAERMVNDRTIGFAASQARRAPYLGDRRAPDQSRQDAARRADRRRSAMRDHIDVPDAEPASRGAEGRPAQGRALLRHELRPRHGLVPGALPAAGQRLPGGQVGW